MNSKQIKGFYVRSESFQLLGETGKILENLDAGNDSLNRTPGAKRIAGADK